VPVAFSRFLSYPEKFNGSFMQHLDELLLDILLPYFCLTGLNITGPPQKQMYTVALQMLQT
jgi:hypothetical protein